MADDRNPACKTSSKKILDKDFNTASIFDVAKKTGSLTRKPADNNTIELIKSHLATVGCQSLLVFGQGVIHGGDNFVNVIFGTNQRGTQAQRIVKAGQATIGASDHDPLLQTIGDDGSTH